MFFQHWLLPKQLQQDGCQVSWLATPTGMENRLLKDQNIPIYQIDIQGVRGNGILRKMSAPFKILKSNPKRDALYETIKH